MEARSGQQLVRPALAAVTGGGGNSVRYFKIISLPSDDETNLSDIIPCHTFDPFDRGAVGVFTWVAKIDFLRGGGTWHEKTRLGIKYFYSDGVHHERTALRVGGNGTDYETQTMVPGYAKGDIVRATRIATGLTAPGPGADDDPIPVVWEEDAGVRMWTVLP